MTRRVCKLSFWILLSVLLISPIQAQTRWLDDAERRIQNCTPGTDEHLVALCERNQAMFNYDLEKCVEFCDHSIAIARRDGKRNAQAVFLMQKANALGEWKDQATSATAYRESLELFDGKCDPRLCLVFYFTQAHFARISNNVELVVDLIDRVNKLNANSGRGFFQISTAIEVIDSYAKCKREVADQEYEKLKAKIQDVDSKDYLQLKLQVAKNKNAFEITRNLLDENVQDAVANNERATFKKLNDELTDLLDRAKELGYRKLQFQIHGQIAQRTHLLGDYERALEHANQSLELAQKIKSNRLMLYALALKLGAEINHSSGVSPKETLAKGDALLPLVADSKIHRMWNRMAFYRAWSALDMTDLWKRYEDTDNQNASQLRDENITTQLEARLQELEDEIDRKSATVNEFKKSNLAFKRLCQWLVGILGLVLACAYGRLRFVNRRLKREADSARRDRELCEFLERRVAQVERMDSLGALAGGIAHDFNNLLVGVLCNAEILRDAEVDDAIKSECVDAIINSAETAADLSRKMLAYAGKQPSSLACVDLNDLIEDMRPLLKVGHARNHRIDFHLPLKNAFTEIDSTQIEQVVLNLVSNALDAMPDGGNLTIAIGEMSLDTVENDKTLFGNRTDGGDFVFLEVSDTGKGIPPEKLARVFEPFFTSNQLGRGMGLAVVYGIVNRHNGLVQCVSEVGKGTSIRVLLPKSDNGPVAVKTAESAPAKLKSGNILVIDDEPSVRQAIERVLTRAKCNVTSFSNGVDAINYLLAGHDDVDCVIVDVVMPIMDGRQVVQSLEELGFEIPVIIISGFSQTDLSDFVQFSNVALTLQKPFTRETILEALSQVITEAEIDLSFDGEAESNSVDSRRSVE